MASATGFDPRVSASALVIEKATSVGAAKSAPVKTISGRGWESPRASIVWDPSPSAKNSGSTTAKTLELIIVFLSLSKQIRGTWVGILFLKRPFLNTSSGLAGKVRRVCPCSVCSTFQPRGRKSALKPGWLTGSWSQTDSTTGRASPAEW